MISNNGQEYPLQIVFNVQETEKRVEILGVRVGDLRSSDMRKDQGKARQGIYYLVYLQHPDAFGFGGQMTKFKVMVE